MKEHAQPKKTYIEDSKGNVFKIKNLNKKQTTTLIGDYKKRGRISIAKLKLLYNQLYDIEARTMPRYAEMRRLEIFKKISRELGIFIDDNLERHFKKLDVIKEQYEVVNRNQLVLNMAILQLENDGDKNVIIKLLKQCQLEDWNIKEEES